MSGANFQLFVDGLAALVPLNTATKPAIRIGTLAIASMRARTAMRSPRGNRWRGRWGTRHATADRPSRVTLGKVVPVFNPRATWSVGRREAAAAAFTPVNAYAHSSSPPRMLAWILLAH